MTARGVPPPNLPLSSSDGGSGSDMKSSSSEGAAKGGEENKEGKTVGSQVLSPPDLKSEVSNRGGLEQPLQGGQLPGGGVDAPDPLLRNNDVDKSKPVSDSVVKQVKKEGKSNVVEEDNSLFQSPMDSQSGAEPVVGDTSVKEEATTPQSMAEATPLAPTAFRKPDAVRRKKRRWVLVAGGVVIIIFVGIVGVAAARFFISATEEGEDVLFEDMAVGEETGDGGGQDIEISVGEDEDNTTEVTTSEEAILDDDKDGLTVAEERFYGTDSQLADTDGDGYSDGEEVRAGYDPLGPGKLDSDNDGFPDPDEREFGSDPFNPDTDGDGYSDGDEIKNGHNPLIPAPGDKL